MIAVLLAMQAVQPGPSAAEIAGLDYQQGITICTEFHHVHTCPSEPLIVSAVRCEETGDGAACSFRQALHGVAQTQSCRGTFVRRDDRWSYPSGPDAPGAAYLPGRAAISPTCTDTGSPTPAEVAVVRAAAHARLGCVLYPGEGGWACPPRDAPVGSVECTRFGKAALYACNYSVAMKGLTTNCQARFRREGPRWTITGGRSRDGRFTFDESCR